jgi:glutamate synthase (NADPH/NADH) small chain
MEHLVPANRAVEGDGPSAIDAADKHVVIIGGGDTAADCLGTAHRQGAASVVQLDQYPEPPSTQDFAVSPWPTWPLLVRNYPAHDEGGSRKYSVAVQRFVGDADGHVRAIELRQVRVGRDASGRRVVEPVSDDVEVVPADMVLLAIGFEGVEPMPLLDGLGISLSGRGTLSVDSAWQTSTPGVFACGDAHRGASLVVWAIAEGRSVAHAVDSFLTGSSELPSPVQPNLLPLAVV